jgi:hypothetical protein
MPPALGVTMSCPVSSPSVQVVRTLARRPCSRSSPLVSSVIVDHLDQVPALRVRRDDVDEPPIERRDSPPVPERQRHQMGIGDLTVTHDAIEIDQLAIEDRHVVRPALVPRELYDPSEQLDRLSG